MITTKLSQAKTPKLHTIPKNIKVETSKTSPTLYQLKTPSHDTPKKLPKSCKQITKIFNLALLSVKDIFLSITPKRPPPFLPQIMPVILLKTNA